MGTCSFGLPSRIKIEYFLSNKKSINKAEVLLCEVWSGPVKNSHGWTRPSKECIIHSRMNNFENMIIIIKGALIHWFI